MMPLNIFLEWALLIFSMLIFLPRHTNTRHSFCQREPHRFLYFLRLSWGKLLLPYVSYFFLSPLLFLLFFQYEIKQTSVIYL